MDPFKPYVRRPVSRASGPLDLAAAEAIALKAVAYVVADRTLCDRFTALTGCAVQDLGRNVERHIYLAGILDFVLGDEACAMAFSAANDLAPDAAMTARRHLENRGGATSHRPEM